MEASFKGAGAPDSAPEELTEEPAFLVTETGERIAAETGNPIVVDDAKARQGKQ